MNEAAHFPGFLLIHEEQRIKVLHLGGEADGMAGKIEGFDLCHTASARQEALPDLRGGFSDPADEAKAGDDNTTLLHFLLGRLLVLFDVIDGVFDGFNFLGILVWDLDVEGFFELHDEFDDVEGVCAEIFLEARAGGDLSFVHLKLLDNNLFYLFVNCCHFVLLFKLWNQSLDIVRVRPHSHHQAY